MQAAPPQPSLSKMVANKLLDTIVAELNKAEMKETIRNKIVVPLMTMIYKQLYPYIYTFVIMVALMFVMVVGLLVAFLIHLRK